MISNRPGRSRRPLSSRGLVAAAASIVIAAAGLQTALAFHDSPTGGAQMVADSSITHLLVSEVMTGGASATDEFIEIYNPATEALPLEGLEVVYVTASGGTVTRKASWPAGSAPLAAGAHVLVANSAGLYTAAADQTYTSGLAATGGSVAIRIVGAATAIDAAGWGIATSSWLEGTPAPAVPAGHSIERLPGGAAGSGQDTDQNSIDFVDRAIPAPQNSSAPPISVATPTPTVTVVPTASVSPDGTPPASATGTPGTTATAVSSPTALATATPTPTPPTPTPVATASPTPPVTPVATASPTPTPSVVVPIMQARAAGDGAMVTVEGIALTDSAFTDGGGYIADASAGVAVLLSGRSFERGTLLRVTGTVDDRFSQRTIRADASGIEPLGSAPEPGEQQLATGAIGEDAEGELVAISGMLTSGPTQLTTAVAFDVDDGTGAIRVLVGTTSGIDLGSWTRGSQVHVRGVIGQRDSSGTGTAGYRLQPRDASDVLSVDTPTPTPTSSASPSATPTASPSANPAVITIAAARTKPSNSRVAVRGVVTLPSGLVEQGTAAIQDATGAIVLRLSDEAGTLRIGELVEVAGTRSTKSGMETLRVVATPRHLGPEALPDIRQKATGSLGEGDEAVLVSTRGAVTMTPRRTSADNVYFDVDDGSGPVRVFVAPGAQVDTERLLSGTRVEIVGVLGQETTGSLPDRGYRLWPRRSADVRIVAQPAGVAAGTGTGGTGTESSGGPRGSANGAPSSGGGGVAGSRPSAAAQQAVPRLQLATSPPIAVATAAPAAVDRADDEEPETQPLAAGLLLLGGLLLIGSAVATGDPGLPTRILAWLRAVLRRRAEGTGDDDDAVVDDDRTAIGLPRLVPLPVAELGEAGAPRVARSIHEERERILPPT